MRLLESTAGKIIFDGRDITKLSRADMRPVRRELMMIFQDPYSSLNPRKRVGFIVGEPIEVHGIGTPAQRKRRVQELLEIVGLNPEHYNRFPHEFSGGQRQRIGIARALAVNPKLVVCDEAVSALDVSVQAQILNLLKDLQSEFGLTYIFIAHDLNVVRHVSDRVMVMYLGKAVEIATKAQLYTEPKHPYTAALLSAVPIANPELGRQRKQIVLEGDVPNPINPPPACRFHTRCPRFVEGTCDVDEPLLVQHPGSSADHVTACHFPLEKWPITDEEIRRPPGVRVGRRADPAVGRARGARLVGGVPVLVGALRRFAVMFGGIGALTVVLALAFGAVAGAPLSRSIAIGLYLVGSVILIFGFFVGNRGPLRHDNEDDRGYNLIPRGVRRATLEERKEAINISVLFVVMGLGLIVLGVLSDSSHKLF